MIIKLDWITFQQRFMKSSEFIYVLETEAVWILYTCNNTAILKTVVFKQENSEQNIAFVDRHLNNSNIVKVVDVKEEQEVNFNLVRQ